MPKSELQEIEEELARRTALQSPKPKVDGLWSQAKQIGKDTLREGVPILGGALAGAAAFPVGGPVGSAVMGATTYGALKKGVSVADRGFKLMPVKDEMTETAGLLKEGLEGELLGAGLAKGAGALINKAAQAKNALAAFKKHGVSLWDIINPIDGEGRAVLHNTVPKMLRDKVENFRPSENYTELFQQAENSGGKISTPKTLDTILKNRAEVMEMSEGAQQGNAFSTSYGAGLEKKIAPGHITPKSMQAELKYLGSKIGKEGLDEGLRKQTIKSMFEDLNDAGAAGTPGAKELQQARKVFKRDSAVDNLMTAIDDATMVTQGQGGNARFAANKIINEIARGKGDFKFFKGAFQPEEQAEIIGLLEAYNKLPGLQPPPGTNYGSGSLLKSAGFGGIAGAFAGGPGGAALGTVLGPLASSIATNFKAAMSIPEGRQQLAKVLREQGSIGLQQALTAGSRLAIGNHN